MKVFGLRLFQSKEDLGIHDVSVAVLRGLIEAHRGSLSPQETLAILMEEGNRELHPNEWTDAEPKARQKAKPLPAVNETEVASVAELETQRLVELLKEGAEDDVVPRIEAAPATASLPAEPEA